MKYLIPILLIIFILTPTITQAVAYEIDTLLTFVGNLLRLVGLGIAVIIFIISGIMYMTASGDEGKLTTAKKTLFWGIIGTALIFAAGWLLDAIQQLLMAGGVY